MTMIMNPDGSLEIGVEVPGGTPNRVLYIDSNGNFADDADMTYDGTSLTLANVLNANGGVLATMADAVEAFKAIDSTNSYWVTLGHGNTVASLNTHASTSRFDFRLGTTDMMQFQGNTSVDFPTGQVNILNTLDVDGAVNMDSTLQVDGVATIGTAGSGDSKIDFYDATVKSGIIGYDQDRNGTEGSLIVAVLGGASEPTMAANALMEFYTGIVQVNPDGADVDFVAQGDTDTDLLRVDASTDRVGISTATPSALFDIDGIANFDTTQVNIEQDCDFLEGISVDVETITATSATLGDDDYVVLVDDDTAGSTVTITLPAAASHTGRQYHIKKMGTTANVIVDGNASETIDGGTTATLTTQYEAITIVCDGSNWSII